MSLELAKICSMLKQYQKGPRLTVCVWKVRFGKRTKALPFGSVSDFIRRISKWLKSSCSLGTQD